MGVSVVVVEFSDSVTLTDSRMAEKGDAHREDPVSETRAHEDLKTHSVRIYVCHEPDAVES